MADIGKMVSASLCGIPLAKASLAIGVLHSVVYGFIYFYELTSAFTDWLVILTPAGMSFIFYIGAAVHMVSSEAFLCVMAGICLAVGAWKSRAGLLLTWLVQQTVIIMSSLLTLFYFLVAAYLHVPILNCVFEMSINVFQAYFFFIVYAHFLELRKGNLQEDSNHLVNDARP